MRWLESRGTQRKKQGTKGAYTRNTVGVLQKSQGSDQDLEAGEQKVLRWNKN